MYPIPPGIPKCLHLFRFAGNVIDFTISHIAAGGGPLKIGVKLDPIGRIEIDALHLTAQAFPLSQRGHHLQAVTEDHPVAPVGVMLVELGLCSFGETVKVVKKIKLLFPRDFIVPGATHQVVNQNFRVNLLLDKERGEQ